jgi:heptosyltransferase II
VHELKNILVVQTAFLGDVILTLPLVQVLKRNVPDASIDFVLIPRSAELLVGHPAIQNAIVFDKRGKDAGLGGLFRVASELRRNQYDVAFVPHRSLRSAALVALAGIPQRIGFHTSTGRIILNRLVRYESRVHEVQRNLNLLRSVGIEFDGKEYPALYPSDTDKLAVDRYLQSRGDHKGDRLIGIAPGTIWNTKRWLPERFAELSRRLAASGWNVHLLGGAEDRALCEKIATSAGEGVRVAAGEFALLQSAEFIRRCAVVICNDSAPMHLAVAMKTPAVAIFGATVPEFGFAPYGSSDIIAEVHGLSCRPCSIHGGDECPVATFDCMKKISVDTVYTMVAGVLEQRHPA